MQEEFIIKITSRYIIQIGRQNQNQKNSRDKRQNAKYKRVKNQEDNSKQRIGKDRHKVLSALLCNVCQSSVSLYAHADCVLIQDKCMYFILEVHAAQSTNAHE